MHAARRSRDGARPACRSARRSTADVIAHLSIKPPTRRAAPRPSFTATRRGQDADGRAKAGEPVVTWDAPDPIGAIVDVFASSTRIASRSRTRCAGSARRSRTSSRSSSVKRQQHVDPTGDHARDPARRDAHGAKEDPKVTKAVEAARKAPKPKRRRVAGRARDRAGHSEAHYQLAALHAAKRNKTERNE